MSWVLAFAGFALLVILHEAGHMVAAKAVGMRVERFFLFFPPKLVSWQRGETEYGIGMIPLGGFVKITGMNPDEVHPPEGRPAARPSRLTAVMEGDAAGGTADVEPLPPELVKRAYYNQPVWKRIVVIGAGPAVNIAIAFLVLFGLSLHENKPTELGVHSTEAGTPARSAGLAQGDRIVSFDGVAPRNSDLSDRAKALSDQLSTHTCTGETTDKCVASTAAAIIVVHDGRRRLLSLKPFYDEANKRYRLGFAFQAQGDVSVDRSAGGAAGEALDKMWFVTSRTFSTLGRLFKSEQRKQINGVVGSYEVTRQAIAFDARTALTVLAIISLSLGIINLLPFLPLDGGHIFWSLVEKFRGRPVPFSIMERASVLGFVLVLMLFAIGLFNDIGRLTGGGFNVK